MAVEYATTSGDPSCIRRRTMLASWQHSLLDLESIGCVNTQPVSIAIGTLNEGPLHQALKALYVDDDGQSEVAIDGYIADVRAVDDVLYEIQTSGFSSLKNKLHQLVARHRVVLVYPVARTRTIVKLPRDADELATRRRSPKKGAIANVVAELVSIPRLLNHPNFELEVVLICEDEVREYGGEKYRRRKGWRVVQRQLTEVLERQRFKNAHDLFRLAPGPLAEVFTTRDLAEAMSQSRMLAQKLAYCLREAGEIEVCGKVGNALEYRRVGVGG